MTLKEALTALVAVIAVSAVLATATLLLAAENSSEIYQLECLELDADLFI